MHRVAMVGEEDKDEHLLMMHDVLLIIDTYYVVMAQ